jgi:hypothetical protein
MSHLAGIVLDCRHASALARFWEVALGWRIRPYDEAEVARLAALGLTPETDPMVAIDSRMVRWPSSSKRFPNARP